MNTIKKFVIDTLEMPTAETTKKFKVVGDVGSEFVLFIAKNGTIKYYDFIDSVFTDGHISSNNNLKVSLDANTYNGSIVFPSTGGEFIINLTTSPGTKVHGGGTVIQKTILKQSSDNTVTLQPFSLSPDNYATFPTVTSAGALADTNNVGFDWDITNAATDAGGFGLIPTGAYKDLNSFANLWFFTTTETVDGAVSLTDDNGGYIVKVDDLTDIGIGSYIASVSSGGLVTGDPELPVVKSINTATKEIELSIPQAFADGITLTFRAYGSDNVNNAIGVRFVPSFALTDPINFEVNKLPSATVRAGSSGTTINLNGTYGFGHNTISQNQTQIGGVGVTTASIVSVTASSSAGSIVVSASQGALTVGTTIRTNNGFLTFNVVGDIKLLSYPASDKTIHLDVDQFLTPGAAS